MGSSSSVTPSLNVLDNLPFKDVRRSRWTRPTLETGNSFRGNPGETSGRPGGAHMGFSELNWTALHCKGEFNGWLDRKLCSSTDCQDSTAATKRRWRAQHCWGNERRNPASCLSQLRRPVLTARERGVCTKRASKTVLRVIHSYTDTNLSCSLAWMLLMLYHPFLPNQYS